MDCLVSRWALPPRAVHVTPLCVFVFCMLSLGSSPPVLFTIFPFCPGRPVAAKPCTHLPPAVASARGVSRSSSDDRGCGEFNRTARNTLVVS